MPVDPFGSSIEREPSLPPLRPEADGDHATASRRPSAAPSDARGARRDASLRRNLGVLVAAVLGLLLATVVRDMPNEARADAQAAVEALDIAADAVVSGTAVLDGRPRRLAGGVSGALVGRAATPLLTSSGAGACFTLQFTQDQRLLGQRFSPEWGCTPDAAKASLSGPGTGRAVGPPAPVGDDYPWGLLLPDPVRWRSWYLLAVMVLSGLAIAALIRAAIVAVTGSALRDDDFRL